MKTRKKLDLSEVRYSELKNDAKGVEFELEGWYLQVERKGKLWLLQLIDLNNNDRLTGTVKLLDLSDLRHTRRAKPVREKLKTRWNNVDNVIEKVLIEIENHKEEWTTKEKPEETQGDRFSEAVEASIQAELAKILDAENQLQALNPHLDAIIVGGEDTKKAVFALLAGSKHSDVQMKQIIILKGTEGGGKSTLARELSRNYNVKEVGRFSAHALDYSNLEGFDILSLKELGSMDMEKQGISTLKFLSSDDRGYTVEVTVKDEETGKFTTEQHRIPAMTVISTTTRLILDRQFERRAWLFNIDETEEQTRQVLYWKAGRERQRSEKLLGLREVTDYEFSREVISRFVEQFKPLHVIIPFPKTLTEVLGATVLRIRGDLDKLYSFIRLYSMFNKKRLRRLKENVYGVTPEVCMEALQTVMKPLSNMISRMDDRTTQILTTLKELEIDNSQDTITKSTRERIAVRLGKSENTILKFLNFLEHGGLLSGDGKKPKTHTLLYSIEKIEANLAGISGKLESPDNLMENMEKEAQKWLETLSCVELLEDTSYLNRFCKQFGTQNLSNNTVIPEKLLPHPKLSSTPPSLTETNVKNQVKQKHPIIQREPPIKSNMGGHAAHDLELFWIQKREGDRVVTKTGEVLFHCPVCWRFKKQAFFSSRVDLNTHLERCHSGVPKSPQVQIPAHNNLEQAAYAKVCEALKGKVFSPYVFEDSMNEFGFTDAKRIDRLFWSEVAKDRIHMTPENMFHFTEG